MLTDLAPIEHRIGVFSRESARQGDEEGWGAGSGHGDARLRLYRTSVNEYSILDPDVQLGVRVDVKPRPRCQALPVPQLRLGRRACLRAASPPRMRVLISGVRVRSIQVGGIHSGNPSALMAHCQPRVAKL